MPTLSIESHPGPPCPFIRVTVEGLTAGDQVVNVWRVGVGSRDAVQGARGLPVVDSFFVDDFSAPFGRPVTYELEVLAGADAGVQGVKGDGQLDSESGYIHDPLNPASAVPIYGGVAPNGEAVLRPEAFASMAYEADLSLFNIMGDNRPVSISGARRTVSGVPLEMSTHAAEENARLRLLVQDAVHLVIRPLPAWGDFIPPVATYAAARVEELPVDVSWGGSFTRWMTSGDTVRPISARVLIALWTYQDVAEIFSDHAQKQIAAGGGTYLMDQKNPANV